MRRNQKYLLPSHEEVEPQIDYDDTVIEDNGVGQVQYNEQFVTPEISEEMHDVVSESVNPLTFHDNDVPSQVNPTNDIQEKTTRYGRVLRKPKRLENYDVH